MKKNKVSVVINKPVSEVFEFTTNLQKTHLWVPSVKEEIAEEYPPKVGTIYKNRDDNNEWRVFKVVEFKPNESFIMTEGKGNFSVKYTYKNKRQQNRINFLGLGKKRKTKKDFF
jgi:uncharacterized protein YndB with AHSA1/START domain